MNYYFKNNGKTLHGEELMAKRKKISYEPHKFETGLEGFEHISKGGLTKNRVTLIAGTTGSCKTILSVELLYRGATKFDRPGVFVAMEEDVDEIKGNVQRFGWDLDALIEQNKLDLLYMGPTLDRVEEMGSYSLDGLLLQIDAAIENIGAKLVVLDSMGSLFEQFQDKRVVRRELLRLCKHLKSKQITTILTSERKEEYGVITPMGIEEFVADNVIILRNALEAEQVRRTIQILKMRGESHSKGEFLFTLSDTGLSILPLSAMELKQSSSTARLSSGNPRMDEMTHGGFFKDSIILVSGPTGSGKSLQSMTFAAEGCRNQEKVLMLAYEESRAQLLRNAQSWGMDFRAWEEAGLLKIVCQYPESQGLEDHLLGIRREIERFHPNRLVIDSISAMERVSTVRNFREFVIGLTSFVKQEEVCSLLTCTTPRLSGGDSVTEAHISTITDIIVILRYVEINGMLRRGTAVIKMRGSQHEKAVYEFTIDGNGLHIGEPFQNVQNIILGIPSSTAPSEVQQLEKLLQGGS